MGAWNDAILGLPVHACGSGAGIVTNMTRRMEHQHYIVVMDNFFTSPMLFDVLLQHIFYAIGTIWMGRLGYPTSMNMPRKRVHGGI